MCTGQSSIERSDHFLSLWNEDSARIRSIVDGTGAGSNIEMLCVNDAGKWLIAQNDLLAEEPIGSWCVPSKPAGDFQAVSLLEQDIYSEQQWFSAPPCNLFLPGTGGRARASSVTSSESSSSDDESTTWSTNRHPHELKRQDTVTADYTCATCRERFSRIAEIEKHIKETKHKAFPCTKCNVYFSRQDALSRHRKIHGSQKLYPCPLCDKYSGATAFIRRDHLRQHLSKKHRVHPNTEFPQYCPYEWCVFSVSFKILGGFDAFESRREYSKHMREIHGDETHDCDADGCDRVGNKGFARLNDLQKHKKAIHGKLE